MYHIERSCYLLLELFNNILGVLDQSKHCWHTVGLKHKNVKLGVYMNFHRFQHFAHLNNFTTKNVSSKK